MTIHHATLKRAAQHEITLTESQDDDGLSVFTAVWKGHTHTLIGVPAKDVLDDMVALRTITLEWPGLKAGYPSGQWVVVFGGEEIASADRLAEALSDALEYCQENEEDPSEAGEDEEPDEEEGGKVIVAAKYRKEYAARGNPDNCGDWIATTLAEKFNMLEPETNKTIFDWRAFQAFLIENGVDMSGKWADYPVTMTGGWRGRYRMNGRQKLELAVARTGEMKLGGRVYKVPAEALQKLWAAHPDCETQHEEARLAASKKAK